MANGLVVSADDGGANPLIADRTNVGDWEAFEVIDNDDGTISLLAKANDLYVTVDLANGSTLIAKSETIGAAEKFQVYPQDGGGVALQSKLNDLYVSADLNLDGVLNVIREAVGGAWEVFTFGPISATQTPDFGPNVLLFDPAMPAASIQSRVNAVFGEQEDNQFGDARYAFLFKPGSYDLDVNVGFYTHVVGLGASPDDVMINGAVRAEADWFDGNATQNFWRAAENFAVTPDGGTNRWAVSQAAPFRRVHVLGNLVLDDGGWSSGGLLADAKVDGQITSGSQQQWLTRNTNMGSWAGANWNMVFVGVLNAPGGNFPNPPYTRVNESPVIREKPFLMVDEGGNYQVFVPSVRTNAAGKHLLLTPGVYHLGETIEVTQAGTVVLGLGLATLIPDDGVVAMTVADVDGVKVAGILFDAGPVNSPLLMQVGPPGSSADHSDDPTSLHDVFFRVGGAAVGKATVSLEVNSDDVIGDHFWIWRGDHTYGIGWNSNTADTGLIVNGDDVTIYGLFVEHYQKYQTIWNGERGRTYFYQNEIPYDVPNQASWMNGGTQGYAAYKVADDVTTHEAWGLGSYCFFSTNDSVILDHSFEVPNTPGVKFHNMTTVSLGGRGTIRHVINGTGGPSNSATNVATWVNYP
jgi:hypothetical protein